eukprot:CAMPEP_0168492950 /NCGR_PEP_ID=MMETSP0228-20121227/70477_1 /TAXON_ID=133427 /ORGANISM="Protoceratium reticulatum, Strain CCCM 535 (=CCMP 1889)" /LENGTH=122 /DNA_ID=CAMNT_0008509737 /DNA_START=205 /DNA_END=571 /DNA_ORIENTATION=+
MTSIVDTKVAIRTFKSCVKGKGAESCLAERKAVVDGVSGAVKSECAAYVDDFFGCFVHRYQLSSCNDATVAKLLGARSSSPGSSLRRSSGGRREADLVRAAHPDGASAGAAEQARYLDPIAC